MDELFKKLNKIIDQYAHGLLDVTDALAGMSRLVGSAVLADSADNRNKADGNTADMRNLEKIRQIVSL